MTTFLQASAEFNQDRSSVSKCAKLSQMLPELNILRANKENDIQLMEAAVANKTALLDGTVYTCTETLSASCNTLYYDLAAFAEVHQLSISNKNTQNESNTINKSYFGKISAFQMPKLAYVCRSYNGVAKFQ